MKKHVLLKLLPIFLIIAVLLPFSFSIPAIGWSAVNTISACHSRIDGYAYDILNADPAFSTVKFPALADIQNNDYVTVLKTGTGPDVPGRTNGADHYYNPRLESQSGLAKPGVGSGPDAVFDQFTKLVSAYSSGDSAQLAHAASWAAHFAADLYTPYHTQGISRADIQKIYDKAGGKNAVSIPLPSYITGPLALSGPAFSHPNDFIWEIKRFLDETSSDPAAKEDWFDPWYWDGIGPGLHMLESSHVVFEGLTHVFPGTWWEYVLSLGGSSGATGYSSLWRNPAPGFNDPVGRQATQVREFARSEAIATQVRLDGEIFSQASIFADVTDYLRGAIESAATVWRASFSALTPSVTFSIPDKTQPKKFKVQGTVANMAGETALNVQFKLTVTGGTIKSGENSPVVGSIDPNYQKTYTWEVEAAQIGYCTFKLEVIGQYYDTPDLQYAVMQLTAPGILPVTLTNTSANRDHSIVFCLDNSDSMSGQPIIDAMNAGVQAVNAMPYAGVEMALYFFGTNECDPAVRVVDFTINRDKIKAAINTASARGKTPLAQTITTAGEYIRSSAQGQEATIILLTDGMETCDGDPVAAARALNPSVKLSRSFFSRPAYAANNIPIKLQVVGFNIDSSGTGEILKQVAQAGNGNYYSAANVKQLTEALTKVVKEATSKGIEVQLWWILVAGAAFLLLLIVILRRGKRARVPVNSRADRVAATLPPGRNAAGPVLRASVMNPPQSTRRPAVLTPTSSFFCPNCGSRVQAGAAYCTGCGSPVVLATTPIVTQPELPQTYCTQCGFQNAAGSAFCGKCGNSLTINKQYHAADTVPPQNLAYCPQCGAPSAMVSAFCNRCGNSLTVNMPYPATNAVPQQNLNYCPQCGVPNAVGSEFCNKCGSSMALQPLESVPAYQQPQASATKPPSPFWWLLSFFLGVIGGLIAWQALKNRNRNMAKRLLIMSIAWTVLILASYLTNVIGH